MHAKPEKTPGSALEVYMTALASGTNDQFLDTVNLGIGNYSESEYWQQIEAFRAGLFADAGMTRKVLVRARYETKRAIVDAIFDRNGPEGVEAEWPVPTEGADRREYFLEHADKIWESMSHEDQAELVARHTGLGKDWVPPHWRMLKARHEASRSKEARLIDNLFERVRVEKHEAPTPEEF